MTGNRIDFSPEEKSYILKNAGCRLSWKSLARDLERKFPEHNQGRRNGISIRNWYRAQIHRSGEMVTIEVDVPKTISTQIRRAGLSSVEVGQILVDGLRQKVKA